jgi:hypothetical protein
MAREVPPAASETPNWNRLDCVRPFWEWLCHHPLLLIEAGLLLGILWGCVGVRFGAPYLFWAEEFWPQFFAAIGATLLLGKLCFVGYLLDAEADWMKRRATRPHSLCWYLKVTWLPLLVLAGLRLFIPAGGKDSFANAFNASPDSPGYGSFLYKHVPFFLGMVVGIVTAILLLFFLRKLQARFLLVPLLRLPKLKSMLPDDLREQVAQRQPILVPGPLREKVPRDVQLHAVAARFFGLLVAAYLFLVCFPWIFAWVTPALSVCILLGLVADVYGFISFHLPRAVYPGLAFVAVVAIVMSWASGGHRFPGLNYSTEQAIDTDSYEARRKQDCGLLKGEVRDRWLAYYREHHAADKDELPKLVVVAASGGGIRSAFWTAVVLTKLEELSPGFFYHVRLIAGASGGMLGAAHFTAKLDELRAFDLRHGFRASGPEDDAHKELVARRQRLLEQLKIVDNLRKGALAPVAQYWVLRDVPGTLWPFPCLKDRGWALEEAWRESLEGALDCSVRSLGNGEWEGWRPSLVFSPMLVEDGRRLLISNLDLDALTRAQGTLYTKTDGVHRGMYSLSAVEFYRLFPDANEFKLSTAVRMNASFPYVSPAAALPTKPVRRVVDAGYYDNFGIDVAASWIYENREWISTNTSGALLVQIRDAVSQATRTSLGLEEKNQHRAGWQRGLQELSTPPEAASSALVASMSYRNDEQLRV